MSVESSKAVVRRFVDEVANEGVALLLAGVENGAFDAGPTGDLPDDAPLALRLLDLKGRRR